RDPGEQSPEAARSRGSLPQHAKDDGAEQWSDEETKECLNVVHDALRIHYQIGGSDADRDTRERAPAAHADFRTVGCMLVEEGTVDVIRPDGGKGADVARHARHEAGNQRGDTEAQQARAAVAR